MPSDTWVTIRTFDTQPLAELAKITLLDAGIPCRVLNAEVVSMDWLLGNAIGYIPLQVPEDHLEAADRALGGESSAGDLPPGDCPKCGEPLDADGPCPMCGHDEEAASDMAPSAQEGETPVEIPGDEYRPGMLEDWRAVGKSAITAYLFVLVVSVAVMVLGFLMAMLGPI